MSNNYGSKGLQLYNDARDGNFEKVQSLLKEGDLDIVNWENKYENTETPLYIACKNGHLKIVEILVRSGAEVNKGLVVHGGSTDMDGNLNLEPVGWTPLHIAIAYGQEDIVDFLLESGANCEPAKGQGEYCTPMSVAAYNPLCCISCRIIKKLLKKGDIVSCCCFGCFCYIPFVPPLFCPSLWLALVSITGDVILDLSYLLHDNCFIPCYFNYTPCGRKVKIHNIEEQKKSEELENIQKERELKKSYELGLSVNLFEDWKSILSQIEGWRNKTRLDEISDFILNAISLGKIDTTLLNNLNEEKNMINKLPTNELTKQEILKQINSLSSRCQSFFGSLTNSIGFDEDQAYRLRSFLQLLATLIVILKKESGSETSKELETFLASLENYSFQSFKDFTVIEKIIYDSNTTTITEPLREEETSLSLGLSDTLTEQYKLFIKKLEIFRDQPEAQKLDKQIDDAKINLNVSLLNQLQKMKSLLVTGSKVITEAILLLELTSLRRDIIIYFNKLTQSVNFNEVAATRCSRTIKFLDVGKNCINDNDKLRLFLRKRGEDKSEFQNFQIYEKLSKIEWADIEVFKNDKDVSIIGEGSFAFVVKAKWKKNNVSREVAIKVFKEQGINDKYEDICMNAIKEAEICYKLFEELFNKELITLTHGLVMGPLTSELSALFNIRDGVKKVGIVMRLEKGGSLDSVIHPLNVNRIEMTLLTKMSILKDITDSIKDLHAIGGIHGDIKPQNILLSDIINPRARLSDFGLSEIREIKENDQNKSTLQETKHTKGTKTYCAPEMLRNPYKEGLLLAKPSRSTDIYALSILSWELFVNNQKPFAEVGNDEVHLCLKVHQNERPSESYYPEDLPPGIKNIIRRGWDGNRNNRPSAVEYFSAVSHTYNVLVEKEFDIFLSHCWADKPMLSHVYVYLTSLGYRVWYDVNEMGWDLDKSMQEGILHSKVVIVGINSTYQSRPNCLFELRHAVKENKTMVALVLEDVWQTKSDTNPNAWEVSEEIKTVLDFQKKMYCDLHLIAIDPLWKEKDDNGDIKQPPKELIAKLNFGLNNLVKILSNVGCKPSMVI